MPSIEKRGEGVYRIRVFIGRDELDRPRWRSKTVHVSTGGKTEANYQARLFEAEVMLAPRADTAKGTVGDLLTRWLALGCKGLSPTTVHGYTNCVERGLRPALGRVVLKDLNARHLDDFYTERRLAGDAQSTVRNYHITISAALSWAVRGNELSFSPVVKLGRGRIPKVHSGRQARPTTAQVLRLLELAADTDEDLAHFLQLAALTGARRGELCGLRWSDEKEGVLRISRSAYLLKGAVGVKTPKTERGKRTFPLGRYGLAVWDAQRAWAERIAGDVDMKIAADSYVFADRRRDPRGRTFRSPNHYSDAFARLRERAEFPELRLHDLRHYVATTLVGSGTDVLTVAARLGHDPAMTLRVYGAVAEGNDDAAADLMGELLAPRNRAPGPGRGVESVGDG